jgi:hypothetical protein
MLTAGKPYWGIECTRLGYSFFGQLVKAGSPPRMGALRPLGSSRSSWRSGGGQVEQGAGVAELIGAAAEVE